MFMYWLIPLVWFVLVVGAGAVLVFTRPRRRRARPDYARIAELERELGIGQPAQGGPFLRNVPPGRRAALVVNPPEVDIEAVRARVAAYLKSLTPPGPYAGPVHTMNEYLASFDRSGKKPKDPRDPGTYR